MTVLIGAHAVAALVAPTLVRLLGRRAFLLLALVPLASCAWLVAQLPTVQAGGDRVETVAWAPLLQLELAFRVDGLALVLGLLVAGVGALVLAYCAAYFDDGETGLGRFAGVLVAFAGAMLALVLADDLLLLYVMWELTTVFSYLLIGHLTEQRSSRLAAMRALVVTTFGGLAMLVGLVLLGEAAGTYRLSELVAAPPAPSGVVTAGLVLVLVGALSKSAIWPFSLWLPSAMAAPTPVSAYLHAAAMVKAGVYLLARLAPGFADVPVWRPLVLTLGVVTMLVGGYRALRQHDLKLLLAYGTVSQLGFMTVVVGLGGPDGALAGLALVCAHALFKSTLFLTVGAIDHATGTRDLRRLSGLPRQMPVLTAAAVLAALSMAGVTPMAGFAAKESAFDALLHGGSSLATAALVGVVLGSCLTAGYTARFLWGAFAAKGRQPTPVHAPGPLLTGVPVVLAVSGLVLGLAGPAWQRVLEPYVLTVGEPEVYLRPWYGLTASFGLSLLTLAVGALLFLGRRRVVRAQALAPVLVDTERGYGRLVRLVERLAVEATGATQRGSLPAYLAVIFVVLVVGPGTAAVLAGPWDAPVRLWDTPAQLAAGVVVAVAAVATVRARRRLKAAVLLGVTGYGVALLFLLHGAPDLALTQVLVETVSLVVFVLVLRRLPLYFSDRPLRRSRFLRAGLAVAVGGVVSLLALVAVAARTATPISTVFPEQAYDFGGGRNVVNVILVDIRAWDTVGELSVLLVAATGVASLVFLGRRFGHLDVSAEAEEEAARLASADRGPGGTTGSVDAADAAPASTAAGADGHLGDAPAEEVRPAGRWQGPPELPAERRSVIFETVTRLTFHTVVLFSLYLVFAGHNQPGGGFAGGLVAGLALMVRYLSGGRRELDRAAPVPAGLLLGSGLFLSAGVGLLAALLGFTPLQSAIFEPTVPVLGEVKLVTALFFDIGVYLLVIGLVLDVLRSLGGGVDAHIEADAERDPSSTAALSISGSVGDLTEGSGEVEPEPERPAAGAAATPAGGTGHPGGAR
ncbi:Na+/H+ antiporter subunit A [Pseudokineococcus lusitanus]|uniref:Multisubunit sodium/proton antiporter MrpA subunit /multisubunit sodium/proton antiporter MrpB subunit n=1 Tax=Pseudokineococcus lusitanus TaxID=763993 RepID=A0A3N1GA82_9ACTN|nr:Na+/H+ antiporter subunit A [Pseudokineococcus lusitanus]ROP27145.1 multisubunit sodium/proton antiporter MrpA subunit /multisubunit sodium/proton antiporter MrpB subunit [Pseudokineococcus lusitanus]